MRAHILFLLVCIVGSVGRAESAPESIESLAARARAIAIAEFRAYGLGCVTTPGRTYLPEHFEIVLLLSGAVAKRDVEQSVYLDSGRPLPYKRGQKLILFRGCHDDPCIIGGEAGVQLYTEELESRIRRIITNNGTPNAPNQSMKPTAGSSAINP